MKKLLRLPLDLVDDAVYLYKQNYSGSERMKLIGTYVSLGFKSFFFSTAHNTTVTSRVCGFSVTGFSHSSLFFLFREIFIHGEYHFSTDTKSPTFFDLGANIGMATLYFKWRYPSSNIHAFEPDPDTFQVLKRNIENNGLKGVELHNIAIGGTTGAVTFYTNASASGSLRMSVGRERAEGKKMSVPMETLSSFLTTKDVYVKMDTEGSETETIKELKASGKISNIKEMVIEYHHRINSETSKLSEVITPLEEAGFEYELECANKTLTKKDVYQNVMLYCYRP